MKKMQCPVCGYYTIEEEYDYCPVCFWQIDGIQSDEPNVKTGANGTTLINARINYKIFGAIEERRKEYCRLPLEEEKNGIPYSFPDYYYDDELKILYRCYTGCNLVIKADRYGTPFHDNSSITEKKYELINRRSNADTMDSDKWREIFDRSERWYVSHWCTGEAREEKRSILNPFVLSSRSKPRQIDGIVRKLDFWEYVKKLATRDFKDTVLCLDDDELSRFEECSGYTVFEVLEMDDDECETVYKKLCSIEENDRRYRKMMYAFHRGWTELRWDVPEWMANRG